MDKNKSISSITSYEMKDDKSTTERLSDLRDALKFNDSSNIYSNSSNMSENQSISTFTKPIFRRGSLSDNWIANSNSSNDPHAKTFVDLEVERLNLIEKNNPYRRNNERKICDIVEAVSLWRKLYNGIQDNNGNLLRYSLNDAAKKVGISKKSLDDYLLQVKFGKKYGFDFEKHKSEKVGVLRKFVRKHKDKDVQE